MPNHARGHEENRKIVCLTCLKKCIRQIISFQAFQAKLYGINFDLGDARVPQGICDTCRTIMKKRGEGKELFNHHCMTSSLSVSDWKLVAKTVTVSPAGLGV